MKANLIALLHLLLLINSGSYALGTNDGTSCANAFYYEVNQSMDVAFASGQSDLYIEFIATDDSLLLLLRESQLGLYANINQVDLYEIGDCNNLNKVYELPLLDSTDSKEYFEFPNLNQGAQHLLVIKRDQGQGLTDAYLQLQVVYFIINGCVNTQNCYDLINNGDFTYTTVDTVRKNDPFTTFISNNPHFPTIYSQVCSWESTFRTPQLEDPYGNPSARMWSDQIPSGASKKYRGESIKTYVDFDTSETYYLSFQLSLMNGWYLPEYFKVKLIDTADIPNNSTRENYLAKTTTVAQEVAIVPRADMTVNWKTFHFCFKPNDPDYNLIYFFPYDDSTLLPQSYILLDKVSLEKYSDLGVLTNTIVRENACDEINLGKACNNPNISYAWSPTAGLSSASSHNPLLAAEYEGTYTVNMSLDSVTGTCPISQQVSVSNSFSTLTDGKDMAWGGINIDDINLISGTYQSNNATFVVEGEFIVNQDWTLTDCKIWMEEGAKITVNNGATFKFDGDELNSFIKSCANQWDGIYANGSSRIDINEVHPFKNSDNGITLTDGADLIAENIDFEDNKRCIYTSSQVAPRNQKFDVKNCLFKSTTFPSSGLNYYYPQVAIQLNDLKSTHNAKPLISYSTFKGSAGSIKIVAGDSVEIATNRFEGFYNQGLPPYPGNAAKVTTAIDLYGVTSLNDSMPYILSNSNEFFTTKLGIRAYDQMRLHTNRDAFNATLDNNLDPITILEGVKGCTYLRASNNYHPNRKGELYPSVFRLYRVYSGIEIYNCDGGGLLGIIQCEQNVGGNGVLIDNSNLPNKGDAFNVRTHPVKYANRGHTYINAKVINHGKFEDVTTYTPPAEDCSNPSIPCPCPTPPCSFPKQSGYGIKIVGSIYRDFISYFSQDTSGNNPINIPDLDREGIVSEYSDVRLMCPIIENMDVAIRFEGLNTTDLHTGGDLINNFFDIVINNYGEIGSHGTSSLGMGFRWDRSALSYGYNIFCSNNTDCSLDTFILEQNTMLPRLNGSDLSSTDFIIDSTATDSYYRFCNSQRLKLSALPKKLNALKGRSWVNRQRIRSVKVPNNRAKFEKQLAFWLIKSDSSLNVDPTLKKYRDSLALSTFGKIMNSQIKRDSLSKIQQVLAVDQFDLDVKLTSSLNTKVRDHNRLSNQEIDQIKNLAGSCPFEKGVAVYQARNILGQLGVNYTFNFCEQYDTTFRSAVKKRIKSIKNEVNSKAKLYPNPAANSLVVEFNVQEDKNVNLCFFDVLGKLVACQQLHEGSANTISTNKLKNGIYFYRIESDGVLIQNGKQMIQR